MFIVRFIQKRKIQEERRHARLEAALKRNHRALEETQAVAKELRATLNGEDDWFYKRIKKECGNDIL